MPATTTENFLPIFWAFASPMCIGMACSTENMFMRARGSARIWEVGKLCAVLTDQRLAKTIACLIAMFATDICATRFVVAKFGETLPLAAVTFTDRIALVLFIVLPSILHNLRTFLCCVQESLFAGKEAFESLLTMVCDESIWLARDGGPILRSDPRFDDLAGRLMRNSKLSPLISADVSNDEKQRMHYALSGDAGMSMNRPDCLVPATPLRPWYADQRGPLHS